MGACTSDPLNYISDQYGQDVCKYIVSKKSEDYLQQVTPKLSQKVQQLFINCSNSLNKQFDSKQKIIQDFYDGILTQTLKQSRVALQSVKKRQQKNQEQIFGLTRIHQRFMKLRADKDQIIKQYQNNMLKILQHKKQELRNEIQSKQPSIPLLEDLPFWLREKAVQDAVTRYAHEIKLREQQLLSILQKSLPLGNLEDTIRKSVGIQQANDLVQAAELAFQRIKRNLTFSDNPRSCFI